MFAFNGTFTRWRASPGQPNPARRAIARAPTEHEAPPAEASTPPELPQTNLPQAKNSPSKAACQKDESLWGENLKQKT